MAEMVRVLRAPNGERRGEKYFARAKNDVVQDWSGGYAPPMADVWAKNISPLQMDDWGFEGVCEHIDDWQRSGWRSGGGVTMANVGAKNISPVPQMMCGRNR